MANRAGFIGLGNIGRPMAQWLVKKQLPTTVFDVVAEGVEELVREGAKAAGSPREVASASDVIGVCVRDDADVRDVVFGDDGLLAGAERGAVIALHSTILPSTVKAVGEAAAEHGVGVVDAQITGARAGAVAGTLTYMAGGEPEHLERCRPFFETSAAKIIHTGALGSGAATKLCNNLMTYLGFAAAYEANLLAKAAGLSLESLDEVTRSNGNLNGQMSAFLGLHRADTDRSSPDFQAAILNFANLAEKDLAVTLAFARECGITLPATGLCQQLMPRIYGLIDEKRR